MKPSVPEQLASWSHVFRNTWLQGILKPNVLEHMASWSQAFRNTWLQGILKPKVPEHMASWSRVGLPGFMRLGYSICKLVFLVQLETETKVNPCFLHVWPLLLHLFLRLLLFVKISQLILVLGTLNLVHILGGSIRLFLGFFFFNLNLYSNFLVWL